MPVEWDSGDCPAHAAAVMAANKSDTFDHTVKEWDEYTDLREALIWALLAVKFPSKSSWRITEGNWQDVYRRLYTLEKVDGCRRVYMSSEDCPRREVYFTPKEIKSMIGLRVNSGSQSDAEFRKYIFKRFIERANSNLTKFESQENPNETSSNG